MILVTLTIRRRIIGHGVGSFIGSSLKYLRFVGTKVLNIGLGIFGVILCMKNSTILLRLMEFD